MSQALYRKYRSRTLDEVVGQKHITDVLAKALASDRIGHAFLFTGPRGTGKTSIARILAHAINDLPYEKDINHLDIIEIDAASNRRIDDIRDLREKVHVAPTSAQYKVYIIDEVHMLTGESFNALLKTLEEPPAHVVFMLATTEAHKLPATIISRTQRFHLRLIPEDEVAQHLKFIAKEENIKITDEALHLIAQHGEGSFRDSISLLDQLGSLAGEEAISATMVESTLGLAPTQAVQRLADSMLSRDLPGAIATLSQLEAAGTSASVLVGQLLKVLRRHETPTPEVFEIIEALLEVPRSHNPDMKLFAVIVRFAYSETSKKTAALATTPRPAVSAPVAALKKTMPKPEAPAPEPVPPKQTSTKPIENFEWDVITKITAKNHPPLHSVLGKATALYETGTLTLYFPYALHRKKVEDSKYRNQLAAIITEQYGGCPEIVTIVGSPPPKDATAASVAAIMGGGEEVDA